MNRQKPRWNQPGSRWWWIWPPTDLESHYMLILLQEHIKRHTYQWLGLDLKAQERIKRGWQPLPGKSPAPSPVEKCTRFPIISLPPPPFVLLFKIKSRSPGAISLICKLISCFSVLWPLIKIVLCWKQNRIYRERWDSADSSKSTTFCNKRQTEKSDNNPMKPWPGEPYLLVVGPSIDPLQFKTLELMHSSFLTVTSFINIEHVIQHKVFFSVVFVFFPRGKCLCSFSIYNCSLPR